VRSYVMDLGVVNFPISDMSDDCIPVLGNASPVCQTRKRP
jgi:hypothetical protein